MLIKTCSLPSLSVDTANISIVKSALHLIIIAKNRYTLIASILIISISHIHWNVSKMCYFIPHWPQNTYGSECSHTNLSLLFPPERVLPRWRSSSNRHLTHSIHQVPVCFRVIVGNHPTAVTTAIHTHVGARSLNWDKTVSISVHPLVCANICKKNQI